MIISALIVAWVVIDSLFVAALKYLAFHQHAHSPECADQTAERASSGS